MNTLKTLPRCLWKAAVNTINHDGIEHAGYLAFLGLLALFPFLVFLVAIIGVIGQGTAGAELIRDLLSTLPDHIAAGVKPRITEIISGPPQGLLTVSIVGAIWTASSAVEGLRTILNRAYHVGTPPAYWFRRSLSILQLLLFAFILIVGVVLMVAVPLSLQRLEALLHINLIAIYENHLRPVAFPASIAVIFASVSAIYYLIPNIKQRFISVAPGAIIVVLLWIVAAQLLTLYLLHFDQVNLIYGSLGGVIAALIFFYLCNIIFIFGAEFNYQIVHLLGLRVEQKESAPHGDGNFPHPE